MAQIEDRRLTAKQVKALCADAALLLGAARALIDEHAHALGAVRRALADVRADLSRAELAAIPVSRIKDVTGGRLRIGTLERSGYATVLQVLDATPYRLQLLPGIGAQTAGQVHAAARQIATAVEQAVGVRLDIERQDPHSGELVIALHKLVNVGPELPRALETARTLGTRLDLLLREAKPARSRLRMLFAGSERRGRAHTALASLAELLADARETRLLLAQTTADLLRPTVSAFEAWSDFEHRSAEYYSLLAEVAGEPVAADQGILPDDLLAKVNAQELDDTHRRVSLRGYQSFGARFALAQRRVILGDEMGLGKSVEAIAVLAHLRARGATHFLVVCPTSVLVNWVREIESRSTLAVHPLHGAGRDAARQEWERRGGVAVATLDSLHRLPVTEVGLLVVDEAHYVKNPRTKRATTVAEWCRRTERVLFLTGTPMENRVEEFRTLISYLRPDLAAELRGSDVVAGAQVFRKAVSPVYLRRNQQDVLRELPGRVDVEEWVEFSGADLAAYRQAVAEGNFMAMRRAAYARPDTSAKLKRLLELVDDARANDLKVIVFSYFRDVLGVVGAALDGRVHGPISGSLTAARRQEEVDAFSRTQGHAVLLSQIQAGGVGLNLQAASVVIMCEPQVKPSMEAQAVARAHRMGQVRTVQVHRLLSVDAVDQRLLDILGAKAELFDAYARRSDLAESTADAIDISEHALARQIVEEEQRRLAP
ncbi:DEAD/DEAH box helicase [Nonomuraea roseoviolacea]|uniref:Superfamily II DNA or RNA helicase n=1 Tax=Nonomuraea roseoviolacea subsp. carminata TaxID=160689 RepID=A0ABT1K4I9_9ACTN|nr:DEAD/DEAH box helicase [Nonomuraea roseoviolacea]MCP2348928.1 superfamily II DNA or RNA helicase [Nonomuraea roseoviolacea subsp. carminata]